MRRGRWVVYCIAVLSFFFITQPTHAITLGMTATVPLSPLWREALPLNSTAKIDTSHPHILLVSQYSLGIENLPVEKQIIQLLILKNGKIIDNQEKITDKKGVADFVFVSETTGYVTAIVVNKTDTSPFIVKSTPISL